MARLSKQRKSVSQEQIRDAVLSVGPFAWSAAHRSVASVLAIRRDYPFVSTGPIQATRTLMHAAFTQFLVEDVPPTFGVWRRRYDVYELDLDCGVTLRANKVDRFGNRRTNPNSRSTHCAAGSLFPSLTGGVRGFVVLGYTLNPLETDVSSLCARWTNEAGERMFLPLPDDGLARASDCAPDAAPHDPGDRDISIRLKTKR